MKPLSLRPLLPLLLLLWVTDVFAYSHGPLTPTIEWELRDSVLRFTGTGPMPSYNTASMVNIPWLSGNLPSLIARIEVGEGITEIGAYSFAYFKENKQRGRVDPNSGLVVKKTEMESTAYYPNVRSVSLPSTLKKIHRNAFTRLPMSAIHLPEGLEEIGYGAFANTGLRGVKLPSTIKKLGGEAFAGCPNLQGVDMNNLAIGLPAGFFFDCEKLRMILHTRNLRGLKPSTFNATLFQQFPEEDLMEMFRSDGLENYVKTNLTPRKDYKGSDAQYEALAGQVVDEYYIKEAKNETFMFNVDMIELGPYDKDSGSAILHTTNSGKLLLQCTSEQYDLLIRDWEDLRSKIRPTYYPANGRVAFQFATVQIPPAKIIAAPIP